MFPFDDGGRATDASGNQMDLTGHAAACFIMGFEGTTITPHIRSLIADEGLSAVLITEKNVVGATQLTELIKDLQLIAFEAGHQYPLLIAIDQENGPVNSIRDSQYIHQFPSAMGMAACNSAELSHDVAKATADELACIGVNWILGPALDVLSDVRVQPLGVRSAGHDPQEVANLGQSYVRGYRDGGLATCGKHFPTFGSLSFHGSTLEMPIVAESLDELRRGTFIPFRTAIDNGLDAVLVGACRMLDVDGTDVQHACLSEQVVTNVLRHELGFNGLIMSECLEVESLFQTLGVDQAVVMALQAGCHMLMVCNSVKAQREALSGFCLGVESGIVTSGVMNEALTKIECVRSKVTSWEKALNPRGTPGLVELSYGHQVLSRRCYEASVTLVRDRGSNIPLTTRAQSGGTLLLLTPLVESLTNSHAHAGMGMKGDSTPRQSNASTPTMFGNHYLPGENTFRSLGLKLSQNWVGKVSHCTYTATGLRPIHERLIASADCIVVVTADSVRNPSQYGFTKCVAALCDASSTSGCSTKKTCIVVAMGSAYDFLHDDSINPYVCTYDFTEPAIDALLRLLFGGNRPPDTAGHSWQRPRNNTNRPSVQTTLWLAQPFDERRDNAALVALLKRSPGVQLFSEVGEPAEQSSLEKDWKRSFTLSDGWVTSKSFVVRNSSTGVMYGFCSTSCIRSLKRGCINAIIVDSNEQGRGIGQSLFGRAVQYLNKEVGPITELQLDGGIPICSQWLEGHQVSDSLLSLADEFVHKSGQRSVPSQFIRMMRLACLSKWTAPPTAVNAIKAKGLSFTRARIADRAEIFEHIHHCSQEDNSCKSLLSQCEFVMRLYDMALREEMTCSVLLARNFNGRLVASCLVHTALSTVAAYVPLSNRFTGGVLGFTAEPSQQKYLAVLGLATIATSHLKAQALQSVEVTFDEQPDITKAMAELGFELLRTQPVTVHFVSQNDAGR